MSENERQSQTNAVINDKLQSTVLTHLRCGVIFNNHIKKGMLLSLPVKKFSNRHSYRQNGGLCCALSSTFQYGVVARRTKCTRQLPSCL